MAKYISPKKPATAKIPAFGKTWWGAAWLATMEKIGDERLGRGRSYARNGAVREIKVDKNTVLAKVQGSRPSPYRIDIKFRMFNALEINAIKDIIESDYSIASQIAMGVLPESLLPLIEEHKIDIFPAKWSDMETDCSCPDWGDPCKHIAAVYYLLANEIDKDPFLILNLRGIPTQELIPSVNGDANDSVTIEDYFIPHDKYSPSPFVPPPELPSLSFEHVDTKSLFSLLSHMSLFYGGKDFREMLTNWYSVITRAISAIELDEEPSVELARSDIVMFCPPQNKATPKRGSSEPFHNNYHFFIWGSGTGADFLKKSDQVSQGTAETEKKIPVLTNGKLKYQKGSGIYLNAPAMIDIFLSSPLATDTEKVSPSYAFFSYTASLAMSLVQEGAILPHVVESEGGFRIRYQPLMNSEKVRNAVTCMEKMFPPGVAFRPNDSYILKPEGAANEILSVFIGHILSIALFKNPVFLLFMQNDISRVFFMGTQYITDKFEDRQTAKSIRDWLEPLYIERRPLSPVICIEEARIGSGFTVELSIADRDNSLAVSLPFRRVFSDKEKIFAVPAPQARKELSRQIVIAGQHFPPLLQILKNQGKETILLSEEDLISFLSHSSSILNHLGMRLQIPKGLVKLSMPQAVIKAEKKNKSELSFISLDTLLKFSWEIAIGDNHIPAKEFLQLVKSAGKIVKFRDQYILLDSKEVQSILERIRRVPPEMSSMEILRSGFAQEVEGMPFLAGKELNGLINSLLVPEDTSLPKGLKGLLRPYQERGFKWLYSNTIKGLGSCIADDMGLGKTIQVISLILKLKEENRLDAPVLAVVPTTLIGNWEKECKRFAPSLSVSVYHGNERTLQQKGKDIVITTYGVLRRDLAKFEEKEWGLMIIDEAQAIKNNNTDQTRAVKSIKAPVRIAMSGTPVENRLMELWSIFDFVNKGYLGSSNKFYKDFIAPIEKYADKDQADKLRKVIAPFMLRRLKTDKSIISDLPDKLIFDEYCYLTPEQTALYQKVLDQSIENIAGVDGINRKGLIFKLITSLKQICNHPAHFSKKGEANKELSGKSRRLMEIIGQITEMGEKAIIFTQYTEMGELLTQMMLEQTGKEPLFFHGGLTRTKRDKMVETFQNEKNTPVMILSLKAGGTGLNLTAASNVIHYDLWWNPAVEAQATDRAYRIGQQRNVTVHRLITLATFEEKIDEMIRAKKELADMTITTGEQWITELSDKEIRNLFSLGK